MKRHRKEGGAVAVELAFVLPLLLLLLIGIMEYGRVFNVQISLTQAAREGARHGAIYYDDASLDVTSAALGAAPTLAGLGVAVTDDASACSPGGDVTVATSISLSSMSGFLNLGIFGGPALFPINLSGEGVMRCGG
ncbi:TadE/TadG family type IV pilus assembly protein [Arthrobacter sp. H5]|uniref:TadE/TadG family type IV pilus assembly protein n=1 Tax=Arthrobacter sp. H5 TaxID=1267973 RepID=UPI0004875034|nr:TadE/TadG family type IV pilus assembly protein [Arthrobacter sp. H5]